MTDAGKLVVALSRGRDCVWMLSSVQMTGSKPWTSLWEATKHDIVTRQYTRVNVMQFVTVFFFMPIVRFYESQPQAELSYPELDRRLAVC